MPTHYNDLKGHRNGAKHKSGPRQSTFTLPLGTILASARGAASSRAALASSRVSKTTRAASALTRARRVDATALATTRAAETTRADSRRRGRGRANAGGARDDAKKGEITIYIRFAGRTQLYLAACGCVGGGGAGKQRAITAVVVELSWASWRATPDVRHHATRSRGRPGNRISSLAWRSGLACRTAMPRAHKQGSKGMR